MSVINQNLLLTPEGYQISRSVRLRSSASAYFNRTPASAGNRSTWTWSGWVKRGVLGSSQNTLFAVNVGATDTTYFQIAFGTVNPDCLLINSYNITSLGMQTAAVFRDPSAWYHVVFALDTTQATASNRMKLYVNGVQQTSFLTYINYPALNSTFAINTAAAHNIGASNAASNFDGYLTEVNFIDGQALTPSSFGETDAVTGVWKPKKYAGTYGTNGFYLNFSDNSAATAAAIGKDYSGNGNNWTPNNISVTAGVTYDSMLDVPTMWADGGNGRGNYAVLNPLDTGGTAPSRANLELIAGAAERGVRSTFSIPTTGLWYAEALVGTNQSGSTDLAFGLVARTTNLSANPFGISNGWLCYATSTTSITRNGTSTLAGAGTALVSGDVLQIAVDLSNNKGWIGKNNTWFNGSTGTDGDPATGANPTFTFSSPPELFVLAHCYSSTINTNFGQRPFAYTPPTGFKALNTQNLPAGSITTSGSFTGNASADGPFVYLNGVPTAMTINGNAVTFATHVDKTANGFKLRTSSSSYNASGSNTYSITTTGAKFKYANAQVNS